MAKQYMKIYTHLVEDWMHLSTVGTILKLVEWSAHNNCEDRIDRKLMKTWGVNTYIVGELVKAKILVERDKKSFIIHKIWGDE